MIEDGNLSSDEKVEKNSDNRLENLIIYFMIILIVGLIVIPAEWLDSWSLWWNNLQ